MFLHAIGTTGWIWSDQCRLLPEFDCLVPDLPGHGENRGVSWVDVRHAADLVAAAIVRERRDAAVHVVGISLGAYVGLELLSRHRRLIRTAVLSGLNVLPIPNRGLLNLIGTLAALLIRLRPFARANARALRVPGDKLDGYCDSARQTSVAAFLAANREALTYRPPANLPAIDVPTLLLAGEDEHELTHRSQRSLITTMPKASAGMAENLGHAWNCEAPELFSAVVRQWVQNESINDGIMPVGARSPLSAPIRAILPR